MNTPASVSDLDTLGVARAYGRWAPIYDLVFGRVFARGRGAAIEAAERVGGRVLEVGVGTGLSLPDYGGDTRLVGVDISEPMLEKARERVRKLGLRNVEGLHVMDAEALDFADGSFDVVVAQYVVTAVPDPEAALDEFVRVLKPGRGDHPHQPGRRRGRSARPCREGPVAPRQAPRLAQRVRLGSLRGVGADPAAGHHPRTPRAAAAGAFLADPRGKDGGIGHRTGKRAAVSGPIRREDNDWNSRLQAMAPVAI